MTFQPSPFGVSSSQWRRSTSVGSVIGKSSSCGRLIADLGAWHLESAARTMTRDNRRGIPQGSPSSLLLANLYMRRFVLGWKMLGLEQSFGSRIVTYADDLAILCRRGKAEEALSRLREIMGKLKLTVNEDKTRICKVPEGEFDFLDTRSDGCTQREPARRAWGSQPRTLRGDHCEVRADLPVTGPAAVAAAETPLGHTCGR
jgi:reverse transcriptase-like protein